MAYDLLAIHQAPDLGALLDSCAVQAGCDVRSVRTGSQGMKELMSAPPDLVVVDMSLPDIDGLVWLHVLRQTKEGRDLPVIVTGARASEEGTAQAFELGADDFICRADCAPSEMLARLRAVLRRRYAREEALSDAISLGPVRLEPSRRRCRIRGKTKELRPREFEVLEILMRKAGRVLSRAYLLETVWGMNRLADTRTVDVTMSRLRKALGKRAGSWIETIERFGYRFRDPDDR